MSTSLIEVLPDMESNGWTDLVAAIRRILAGERDADALCDDLSLDFDDSCIVDKILAGIADPSALEELLRLVTPSSTEGEPPTDD